LAASSRLALKRGHSCDAVRGHREAGGPSADDGSRLGQHAALRTRSPQKQLLLSLISLGSLAWVVLLLGNHPSQLGNVPADGLPLPGFIDQKWVRLATLIGALVTPLLVGLGELLIVETASRPTGLEAARQVPRG
jgi:hypothetical protein